MELDEDYVKIRDIYQGIYKIFQAEAEKKCIHLKMEYDVKHEHVICDETKNKEIFLNLISNAVKYTASGGTVTIRITELDCDRKDYVRIRTQVIDTGIGMSEEFLPSLFEAFARERNTTDGKIAGTGLGMPIIKKYVDMMGGTIGIQTKQGKGTEFIVRLPLPMRSALMEEKMNNCDSVGDFVDRYCTPNMLIKLRQGVGRLIRCESDTGVVSILDPRAISKSYSGKIGQALHKFPKVDSAQEIESFMRGVKDEEYYGEKKENRK